MPDWLQCILVQSPQRTMQTNNLAAQEDIMGQVLWNMQKRWGVSFEKCNTFSSTCLHSLSSISAISLTPLAFFTFLSNTDEPAMVHRSIAKTMGCLGCFDMDILHARVHEDQHNLQLLYDNLHKDLSGKLSSHMASQIYCRVLQLGFVLTTRN